MNQFRASLCFLMIILLFTPLMLTSSPDILTSSNTINSLEDIRKPTPQPLINSLLAPITAPNSVGISSSKSEKIMKISPMQSRNWTILVYLDGDNDLEEYAFDDLNAMEKIGSTHDVNIIVLVDFYLGMGAVPFSGANCYNVTQDDAAMIINSTALLHPFPAEPNMGDPQTLLDFILFGQSFAPAEYYLLVLWDHGSGFQGACIDDTDGHDMLTLAEITTVLNNNTVDPIDIVAFDACQMGQLEVAYEIRLGTDIVIFSEANLPVTGFPYEDFLFTLTTNPTLSPLSLANEMINRFGQAYSYGGRYYDAEFPYTDITLSAVNTSRLDAIVTWLDELLQTFQTPDLDEMFYEAICMSLGSTQTFVRPEIIDLGGFAHQLELNVFDPLIKGIAQNLSLAINEAIISEIHLAGVPGATGLSFAFTIHSPTSLELINTTQIDQFITSFKLIGESIIGSIPIANVGNHYGYLEGQDDNVFFRFSPTISTTYTIWLDSMQTFDEDFDLYLYDSNQNELTSSRGTSSIEVIQFNFIAGNTYYIRAHSYVDLEIEIGSGIFWLNIVQGPLVDPAQVVLIVGLVLGITALIVFAVFMVLRWGRKRISQQIENESFERDETGMQN